MSRRTQMLCAWCAPLYVVGILVGLVVVAQLIPPPHANESAAQVADLYREDTDRIRAGLFIAITFTALYAPAGVITTQMLRIEKRNPVLAWVQLGNGVIGSLILMIAFMFMMVAAFEPGRDPDITKALHQLGWIFLVIPFPPFCIQYCAIAVGILQDSSPEPVFPRWIAYYNLWIAISFIPTGFVGFFHTGPFAWHGLISFWLAVVVYAGWFFVMFYGLRRAIAQDE